MRASGFTLVELLVTLAIAAIILVTAAPAFSNLLRDNRLVTALNELRGAIAVARTAAITANRQVVLCKSGNGMECADDNGWEQGWLAFVDHNEDEACHDADQDGFCDGDGGRIVLQRPALDASHLVITATGKPGKLIAFTPSGFAPSYAGTISVCDDRGLPHARGLVISLIGRIRVATPSDNIACPP